MSEPMLPRPFRVVRSRRDTYDTVTLGLEALAGPPLEFDAGQFTMLGVPGAGEVPISISGDPRRPDVLEHTVRDAGGITRMLTAAGPGDRVTVRGPFGTGWQVRDGAGGDVVIVAGGIGLAPLRPALLEILARREAYERIVVLYGARTPADILFEPELEAWRGQLDLHVGVTVDSGSVDWRGRVGLVTTLIGGAEFDPAKALALVCGPEVMMRFVIADLIDRGMPGERVRLSMERDMACGVGLC
ncbi:MAG TPA: FAD/NAD(P)-binding protein, partial [Mycobacteriales bacterium]|nr:FAD/NAD(P)-binding protein [Mycobacteriales bacterium]